MLLRWPEPALYCRAMVPLAVVVGAARVNLRRREDAYNRRLQIAPKHGIIPLQPACKEDSL